MARCQRGELHAAVPESALGTDQKGVGSLLNKSAKSRVDVANGTSGIQIFICPPMAEVAASKSVTMGPVTSGWSD